MSTGLTECSVSLIDQAVAQGVPFAREYSGYLNNRSFGGVQVSRTFYASGQTGQQLLLGTYQALMRQVAAGTVQLFALHEMLEPVVIDGKARGVIVCNMDTGTVERHGAHAVVLATGGFGKISYLSTWRWGATLRRSGAPINAGPFSQIRAGHRYILLVCLNPESTNQS